LTRIFKSGYDEKELKSMLLPNIKSSKGFTLIELIVVIGMLTILFAIVLVAVNPGRQFAASRNTARSNDVNAILNSVHQYAADHNGVLPAAITVTPTNVGNITGSSPAFFTDTKLYLSFTTRSRYQ
jgi:prepilin-type N-terminal cleavage/methylation domain-containing protein